MKKFYIFSQAFKRSAIKLKQTNITFSDLFPYLEPLCNKRIPESVVFRVAKGKKEFDIAVMHEAESFKFLSERFIKILEQYYDLSDIVYPINVTEITEKYYLTYNLKNRAHWFNNKICDTSGEEDEPPYFTCDFEQNNIFALNDSFYRGVISCEAKDALVKAGMTNVRFLACYCLTPEEYEQWKEDHKDMPKRGTYEDFLVYQAWKEKNKDKLAKWQNPTGYTE